MELDNVPVSSGASQTDNVSVKSAQPSFWPRMMHKLGNVSKPEFFQHSPLTRFTLHTHLRILLLALGISLLVLAGMTWLNAQQADYASAQTQIAGNALMHSQRGDPSF